MQLIQLLGAAVAAGVPVAMAGHADIYENWAPPGPNDLRGPCPMLNTLANHGLLPRDGRFFTQNAVIKAFDAALNFDQGVSLQAFNRGLTVNPAPNATWFDLGQLSKHGLLEKDASLTRTDAYFGDARAFNETILQSTMSWWTSRHLDMTMLANSKIARQLESRRDNPTYTYNEVTDIVSTGEVATLFAAFGSENGTTVDRELLEFWFRNERLPTSLGWKKPARVVDLEKMEVLRNAVVDRVSLLTE